MNGISIKERRFGFFQNWYSLLFSGHETSKMYHSTSTNRLDLIYLLTFCFICFNLFLISNKKTPSLGSLAVLRFHLPKNSLQKNIQDKDTPVILNVVGGVKVLLVGTNKNSFVAQDPIQRQAHARNPGSQVKLLASLTMPPL